MVTSPRHHPPNDLPELFVVIGIESVAIDFSTAAPLISSCSRQLQPRVLHRPLVLGLKLAVEGNVLVDAQGFSL